MDSAPHRQNIHNLSNLFFSRCLTERCACASWDTPAWWTLSASGSWDTQSATTLQNSWSATGCSWRRPSATPKLLVVMLMFTMWTVYFLKISVKSKMLLLNFSQDNTVNAIIMNSKMFYVCYCLSPGGIWAVISIFLVSNQFFIVSPEDRCCLLWSHLPDSDSWKGRVENREDQDFPEGKENLWFIPCFTTVFSGCHCKLTANIN